MSTHRILFGAALVLALSAALVGTPHRPGVIVPLDEVVAQIESGVDRVDPVWLAGRLRERDPALRIVDLRDPADFENFTLPQAERIALRDLEESLTEPSGFLVLISDDGSLAAQAWTLLRLSGHAGPFVLDGGVEGWIRTILIPSIPEDPPEEERAYWEERVEMTDYFGGTPRFVPNLDPGIVRPGGEGPEAAVRVERLVHQGRELGCGW